jgi:hypothetical protein
MDDKVYSVDSDNIMTHIIGLDANSLYPSVFSSVYNEHNPYTDGKMYMPGRIKETVICETDELKQKALNIIKSKNELFITEIKAHIDPQYINEFINFPPIHRNIEITTSKEFIGEYMYDVMEKNHFKTNYKENKLTMLLSTHDQFMSFSSYYLWLLMDHFHLIIDDIKSIITFTKHDGFNSFVTELMNKRIEAMGKKNKGQEQFCKICLNGSYGYDGMNQEKFNKIAIKNRSQTFLTHIRDNHVSTHKIANDMYFVTYKPKECKCETCIQEAFFTLDNAKFWMLTFVYKFMFRCLDMDKLHFVEGDTDSVYFAVSGNPNEDYKQKFQYVIKDQDYYDQHIYDWLPNPDKDIYDHKKLLVFAIEKEDENCVALAPKCYCLFPNSNITKSKGVSKVNKYDHKDYDNVLNKHNIITGTNTSFQTRDNNGSWKMSKITIRKNCLTGINTKAVVLKNHSCAPFIQGIDALNYFVL